MVTVKSITRVEPNAFQGMDKSWIEDDAGTRGYTFMRVTEGAQVDGFWKKDKAGENMLKKNADPNYPASAPAHSASSSRAKTPEERSSIERQTALKAAVEYCVGTKQVGTAVTVTDCATEFYNWLQNKDVVLGPQVNLDNIL